MSETKIKIKPEQSQEELDEYLNECPDEVDMSFFDHLEELRKRIFYVLIAVAIGIVVCFIFVKPMKWLAPFQQNIVSDVYYIINCSCACSF